MFEKNHPAKEEDFSRTLNIYKKIKFVRVRDNLLLFSEVRVFRVDSKNSENFILVTVVELIVELWLVIYSFLFSESKKTINLYSYLQFLII